MTIEEILTEAVKAEASDVHITTGTSPKMRVNGKLMTMSFPKLFPADTLALLVTIMTQTQREQFEERGEFDMSFEIRSLGRFRVNAYKQRGCAAMAIRLIGCGVPVKIVPLSKFQKALKAADISRIEFDGKFCKIAVYSFYSGGNQWLVAMAGISAL